MAAVSNQSSSDSWDQPSNYARSNNAFRRPTAVKSIPDDWDADDDEQEEDNQKIWEDANAKAPMPELVIASSNTTSVAPPPPAAILQAPMRILKRPTVSPNSNANSASSQPSETLAEREARYQAARERIFGGDSSASKNASDSSVSKLKKGRRSQSGESSPGPTANTNVLRNPLGPSDSPDNQTSKGFKRRSGKGPGAPVID